MTRRKFTKEFKFVAVKLVTEPGIAVAAGSPSTTICGPTPPMADKPPTVVFFNSTESGEQVQAVA